MGLQIHKLTTSNKTKKDLCCKLEDISSGEQYVNFCLVTGAGRVGEPGWSVADGRSGVEPREPAAPLNPPSSSSSAGNVDDRGRDFLSLPVVWAVSSIENINATRMIYYNCGVEIITLFN